MNRLDYLFTGGQYPDFETNEIKKANIGISQGKIAYIGQDRPDAAQLIDITGQIVSPGFIDIHMHEENFRNDGEQYLISNRMLEMGVTTALGGNCGHHRQPLKEFKETIEKLGGSPINFLMQTGYNNLRRKAGAGPHDLATKEQMDQCIEVIQGELDEGAIGISFGVEYDPSITQEELLYVVNSFEDPDLFISEHYRVGSRHDIESTKEMVDFASDIKQRFQISHLSSCAAYGKMWDALDYINQAIEKNPRLNYDTYPYNAFSCSLGSTVFEDGCFKRWNRTYKDVLLTTEPYKNVVCTREIFKEARANYPKTLAVVFAMNEDEIAGAICNKYGMVASDGMLTAGNGHPRAAGTFPRILGKYVREEKKLSLIDALRKMTLEPAKRLLLDKKGRIELEADADLTIFNPDTIIDKAEFGHLQKPEGINYVFIGGKPAIYKAEAVNFRLGRFISYKALK